MTYFNPNEPRWLTTASDVDLDCLSWQQANMVLCLSSVTWRNGSVRHLLEPHASLHARYKATKDLRSKHVEANFVKTAQVLSKSSFTTECACMLLCFADVTWLPESTSSVLQSRSHCGYWWAATEYLVARLYEAGYCFG